MRGLIEETGKGDKMNNKGLGLIEILLVVAILSIVLYFIIR